MSAPGRLSNYSKGDGREKRKRKTTSGGTGRMRDNATWLNAALSKIAHPEHKPAACPGNPAGSSQYKKQEWVSEKPIPLVEHHATTA
jgi:hypothetical protein